MKNKGITIIALVITIIILLILAGISISALTGSGLFEKAKESKEKHLMAQVDEELKLIVNEWIMEKAMGTERDLSGFLNEKIQKNELEGYNEDIDKNEYEIYKRGYAITIDEEGNIVEEIHEIGKVIKVTNLVISKEGEKEEVAEGTVPKNTKLKITFSVELENGEITGVTSTGANTNVATLNEGKNTITYITNGEEKSVTFTITGKIDEKEITPKKYTVSVESKYIVIGKANAPVLMTGMTGVYWDENDNMVEVTNDNKNNWYDYEEKRWANAVTKDGETITGYWVWIPRYEYSIDKNKKIIDVNFIKTEQKTVSQNYTYIHPAFTDGTSNRYANGEWNAEIPGFWVAKFPAGFAGGNNSVTVKSTGINYSGVYLSNLSNYYGTVSTSVEMKYPVFLGQTYAYNYINIGDIYNLSRNLTKDGNPYGLNKAKTDSHMMKNSEWGAVAYLTHSQYGLEGQDKIHINNVNLNGKVDELYAATGYAGEGTDTNPNFLTSLTLGETVTGGTYTSYAWNTVNGQKGSSTQNITGVYDLSGCLLEYTAGYILNTAGTTNRTNYGGKLVGTSSTEYTTIYPNSFSDTDTENWNIYKNTENRYGDAIIETSTSGSSSNSWNKDTSCFLYSGNPFFLRGGRCNMASLAGMFAFTYDMGNSSIGYGFRAVLINI